MDKNYKRFFIKVKKNYPFIVKELNPPAPVEDPGRVPELFGLFCQVSGHSPDHVKGNRDIQRLFVAVVLMLYDPLFFRFRDSKVQKSLRIQLAKVMGIPSVTSISRRVAIAKNYWAVYPEFRDQVNRIHDDIKKCLSDQNRH